jgi:GntR family transcriptional regulator
VTKSTSVSKLGRLDAKRAGSGVSRYYQLYELLSNALQDGTIPPGRALPSEPTLVAQHKISRTTVRRALDRLEREKRIVRLRGSGTFAREVRDAKKLCLNLHSFYEHVPTTAARTSVAVLKDKPELRSAALRELERQLGDSAVVIQKLRKHNGTPYQLCATYVSEAIGRRVRRGRAGQVSTVALLDQLGIETVRAEHTMTAVAADSAAAKALEIPLGAPLLRTRVVFSDATGTVHAVYESLSRPDHFNVRAELERKRSQRSQAGWRLKGADASPHRR